MEHCFEDLKINSFLDIIQRVFGSQTLQSLCLVNDGLWKSR